MTPTAGAPEGGAASRSLAPVPAWAKHKAWADHLSRTVGRERRGWQTAADLRRCAERLGVELRYTEADQLEQRVVSAHFCHHRMCPVCSWRKVQAWRRRLIPGLEAFHEAHPKHRPVFLTLTVRNCRLGELDGAIRDLHAGWARLVKRSEFPTGFWLRRTELTIGRPAIGGADVPTVPVGAALALAGSSQAAPMKGRAPNPAAQNNDAADTASASSRQRDVMNSALPAGSELSGGAWIHPHVHALLLVPPRYFTADYVKQSRWRELWMESARLDYAPVVDIRRGYSDKRETSPRRAAAAAAIEAAKYISKASDVAALGPDLVQLEAQIKGARMIAVSRPLGAFVRPDPIDGSEMVDPAADPPAEGFCSHFFAQWDAIEQGYHFTT